MPSELFLSPRLTGARFDNHAIPLEVLKDLAALEEMLIELAKWKFKQANPQRKRLPRGFGEDISLKLSEIGEGSAIPHILLVFSSLIAPSESQYFTEAKNDLISSIAATEQNLVPSLPLPFLGYFDRIGRSLRSDESMEFTHNQTVARLTPDVRQKLLAHSGAEEWSERIVLRGQIPKADQEKMSFELKLRDESRVKCDCLPEPHLDTVLEAFAGWRQGCKVQIQATVLKDRKGRIKSISELEHISILDPLDVTERLEDLSRLEAGWMDGKGIKPETMALKTLATAFDRHFDAELPLPALFPTLEGGIQAEWSANGWAVTLEIDLKSFQADFTGQRLSTPPEYRDADLDLSSPAGWAELNRLLDVVKEVQE